MGQRELLAYNGFVVGGTENRTRFGLLSWDASDDHDTRTVNAAISVKKAANPGIYFNFAILRELYQEASKSLAIATGTAKTITVDVSVSSQVVTLTRTAGDTFDADDLAMPIEVAGVGAFQVSEYVDANTVRCEVPSIITPPGASVGETATIGNELIRCADFSKTLNAAASGAGDEGDQVGGILARTSIGRPADLDDDVERMRVEFSAIFQRPALEVRPNQDGRIRARIRRAQSPEGLDVVAFTGTITAGSSGGSGALVQGLLSAAIDTWMTNILATINSSATFEEIGGIADDWDDEGKVLNFARRFRQMNFDDLTGTTNDPRIIGANVTFNRNYQNAHGLKGARQPFTVDVNYSCGLPVSGANAVDFTEMLAFWTGTIKPYLIGRARALFGGNVVVLAGGDPVYNPVTSKVSASMVLLISKSGSNIYQYDRVTDMDLDERFDFAEKFDKKDFTAIYWTPGKSLVGTVSVSVISLGDPKNLGGSSGGGGNGLVGGLPGGGIFFSGGGLGLSIPSPGIFGIGGSSSGPGQSGQNTFTAFPNPGEPSRLFADEAFAGGSWLLTRRKASEKVQYWGQDPDSQGSRIKVTSNQYLGFYVWLAEATEDVDPDRDPTTKGPRDATGNPKPGQPGQTQERGIPGPEVNS